MKEKFFNIFIITVPKRPQVDEASFSQLVYNSVNVYLRQMLVLQES